MDTKLFAVLFIMISCAGCSTYQVIPDTPEVREARLRLEAAKVKAEGDRIAAAIAVQQATGRAPINTTVIIQSVTTCNPYYTAWCSPYPYAGIPLFSPVPAFGASMHFHFGGHRHRR